MANNLLNGVADKMVRPSQFAFMQGRIFFYGVGLLHESANFFLILHENYLIPEMLRNFFFLQK